jgi:predicted nucleic acid-binding protein
MNGKFLLDTNIMIALLAGESKVSEKLMVAEEVFYPPLQNNMN